jgi:hypothetical protein
VLIVDEIKAARVSIEALPHLGKWRVGAGGVLHSNSLKLCILFSGLSVLKLIDRSKAWSSTGDKLASTWR